jgi:hypothetical protein
MLGVIVTNPVVPVQIPEAPRRVQVRPSVKKRLWVLRVVAAVSFLVGSWLAWAILKAPLTHWLGVDKTARVDAVKPVAGDKLARWFDVTFSYETSGGAKRVGQGRIDMAGDRPPLVGSGIAVKALSFWPLRHAILKDDSGGFGAIFVGTFLVIFCLIALTLICAVWIAPEFQKRLIRSGRAEMGTVAQKFVRHSRGFRQHMIWYRFRADDGETWDAGAAVSKEQYRKFGEGQAVAVIYAPKRPWRSVLYEASVYEAA